MPESVQKILGSKNEPYSSSVAGNLGLQVTGTGSSQTVPNPYNHAPANVVATEIAAALPGSAAVFAYDRVATLADPANIYFFLTSGRVARLLPIADKG